MPQISIRPGDSLTIGEDVTIQFDSFLDGFSHLEVNDPFQEISIVRGPEPEPVAEPTEEEIQTHLWKLSKEIADGLSKLGLDKRKEFVGVLVGELYYSAAAQDRSEKNRQRQRKLISAAVERGVRFGPSRKPLPVNFDECHKAWRNGDMTLAMAAKACGMAKTTFRTAVLRKEQFDV